MPLRLIPEQAVLPILQGPLRGMKWVAGSGNHGCWLGSYEQHKQRLFHSRVRPGAVVYDMGANVGFYSLLASVAAGPSGAVICFEPLPRNLAYLRRHIALNGILNCRIIDAAVSDAEGAARFDCGPNASMGRLASAPDGIDVRTLVVDRLAASGEIPPPSVLKCDIEGAELAALRGARATLEKYRPIVFLATHGAEIHKECCKLLMSLGYECRALNGGPIDQTDEIIAEAAGA